MRTTLLVLLSLTASAMVGKTAAAWEANPTSVFDFEAIELKILRPDEKQTIGSTHFAVSRDPWTEEIKSETRYLDGEHDNEDERIFRGNGDFPPRLDVYGHWFFNADGSLHMIDKLDTRSAIGSCAIYTDGRVKVRTARLQLPSDTFAGASELMMVVRNLRQGIREIKFHAFACAPGPKIFAVEASLPGQCEQWPLYRGHLVRLDMRPDLGAFSLVAAPFVPKMDAWFNPNDNWNYVGGEFDRYFGGPHIVTVRVNPGS